MTHHDQTDAQKDMEHQAEQLAGKHGGAARPGHVGGPIPESFAPEPGSDITGDDVQPAGGTMPGKIEPRAGRDS